MRSRCRNLPAELHRSLDSPGMENHEKQGKKLLRGIVALVLVLGGLAVSACGDGRDNLLGSETAAGFNRDIDRINELVAAGDCLDALKLTERIRLEVENLGDEADPVLRRVLLDGVTRLAVAVQRDCEPASTDGAATEPDVTEQATDPAPAEDGTTGPEEGGATEPGPSAGGQDGPADSGSGGVSPGGGRPPQTPSGGGSSG